MVDNLARSNIGRSLLLVPILMKRGYQFGQYLAWTFFAAMGITELAHFIFPFFTGEPYQYFPAWRVSLYWLL